MKLRILNEGLNNNFYYGGVDYDYEGKDCTDEGCGCQHGDYCRRNYYVGLKVKDIDLDSIRAFFLGVTSKRKEVKSVKDTAFLDYCVDRLLRIYKVYDKDKWEISTGSGYYGEEIESIYLDCNIFGDIVSDIKTLVDLAPNKRIESVLVKEYGYLLPELVCVKYEEQEVSAEDLVVGNGEYLKKVDSTYKDCELPIGIYRPLGAKYRLVDGYHRYLGLVKPNGKYKIIVAKTCNE